MFDLTLNTQQLYGIPIRLVLLKNLKMSRNLLLRLLLNNGRPTTVIYHLSNTNSLEQRRQYLKLITLFKIYNGFILMPDAPVHIRPLRILRNSQQLFLRPTARTSSFDSSFFSSSIASWNRLPQAVRESNSLSCYKHSLLNLLNL